MEIEINEDSVELLDKYTKIRPSTIELILERIIREWTDSEAKKWVQNPILFRTLAKLPKEKTMKININHDIAKSYIRTLKKIEDKLEIQIDPSKLASFLAKAFIHKYNIKYMESSYKEKFGQIRKV